MIQVGNTGLYFNGGHKGGFEICLEKGKVFRSNCHLNGDNVDTDDKKSSSALLIGVDRDGNQFELSVQLKKEWGEKQ